MSKIVVVDDDLAIVKVMRKILEAAEYTVYDAFDGPSAQEVIEREKPDCIISDLRIPKLSGLDLLAWSKVARPVPFILVTGFSHLVETKKAYELGVSQFITKPFEREELLLAVRKCLRKAGNDGADEEVEFCHISIEEFVSGSSIPYRIFLKLSEFKYVNIAHTGEDVSAERIALFKAKGVKDLYLRKEDFRRYLGFTTNLVKAASKSGRIGRAKKVHLLKHVGEVVVQNMCVHGVDEGNFIMAREFVEASTGLLIEADDAFLLLESLRYYSDVLFRHSVAVSLYSVMIGRNMGIRTPQIVSKLAVGGLFHDIGKKDLDRSIHEKAKVLLSADEVKQIEQHPIRGVEILAEVRSVSSDILQIVLQHHEDCLGYGYPQRLKKRRIHPLARIVSVANLFVKTALESNGPSPLAGEDAINKMIETYKWKLDQDVLVGLLKVFSLDEKVIR